MGKTDQSETTVVVGPAWIAAEWKEEWPSSCLQERPIEDPTGTAECWYTCRAHCTRSHRIHRNRIPREQRRALTDSSSVC